MKRGEHPARLAAEFQTRDGAGGRVEVVYRQASPDANDTPFLVEERQLLDAVAAMLTSALDHRAAEERLGLLLRVTNLATAELDLEGLLATISKLLAEDVGHRLASIVLWDAHDSVPRRHALVSADGTIVIPSPNVMLDENAPAMKTFRTRTTQVYQWRDVQVLGAQAVALMTELWVSAVFVLSRWRRRAAAMGC